MRPWSTPARRESWQPPPSTALWLGCLFYGDRMKADVQYDAGGGGRRPDAKQHPIACKSFKL